MPAASPGDGSTRLIVVEREGEHLGFVAIDCTFGGRARGGLRLVADLDEVEVRDAARAMTLKYGFLGLPQGGAKAGVRGDPDAPLEARRSRLLAFGRVIEPMLRQQVYTPDADLGTTAADIRWMVDALGLRIGRHDWTSGDSGLWTACSVLGAMRAALRRAGRSLGGASVAIEGFGAVGSQVARLAAAAGARIVAVSTSLGALHDPAGLDVGWLLESLKTAGRHVIERYPPGRRLERARLLELAVDVMSPCARRHTVTVANVAGVKARVVCPGGNNALSPEAEAILAARGVTCVPDFVANCGGVLGGTMAFASIEPGRISRFVEERIAAVVETLLDRADHDGISPRRLAEEHALERFARMQAAAAHPDVRGRLLGLGLAGYRRGWLPRWLSATLSPGYFERLVRY